MIKSRLWPLIPQRYLILIAGILWMGIGTLLSTMAIKWQAGSSEPAAFYAIAGAVSGIIIHRLGFLRIVDKNILRIRALDKRAFILSFMAWRSYLLVALMMTMGITLRHSSFPKIYLSGIYMAMGLALFLSSFRYFRHFRTRKDTKEPAG